ncbi:glycosyl hydrolase family 18 protein [Pseudoalteromonas sp. SMS1]|uniref:glycosyl hydrolase family 18 protein n=1 Tax=Pseudoalteromonas sp. SMS1 TaxID=2908894 RepID=UPI001F1C1691|nr:glycosyl hydrolase family 18 protein [Pseudoalteromonas sp. SMS1]MCF2857919.1 glycosyl hydrolase family 18 protein [Pseudoalteromonas sp. SMS1]
MKYVNNRVLSHVKGALLFSSLVTSIPSLAAVPGAPKVEWMVEKHSLVTITDSLAYKDVVVAPSVDVSVPWSKWTGVAGDTVNILLDGRVVHSRVLTDVGNSQSGVETLTFDTGGKYQLTVQLCNSSGCTDSSNAKTLIVADTAGTHLDPLPMRVNDPRFPIEMTNRSYVNTTGKMVAAYAAEWSIYRVEGMDYYIDNIPAQNLTHIFYGFVAIAGPNESFKTENPTGYETFQKVTAGLNDFELAPPDPWAAYMKPIGDQVNQDAIKGNYGQMMALKQRYPDLKIIPSIGGWTLSDPFYFMEQDANRKVFVESCRKFLRTWAFWDGIDIDWEFPGVAAANPNLGSPNDGATYLKLMRELRAMLDEEELRTGRKYELTSAINVGYDKLEKVNYGEAIKYMDYILMMSYDYFGAWDLEGLGHQTAVYPSDFKPADKRTTQYNLKTGIDLLTAQGVPSNKLIAGVAMYGRGWTGVEYTPGTHHMQGKATGPSAPADAFKLEPGTLMYANIAQWAKHPDWEYHYDTTAQAPYIYRPSTGDLISYDDQKSINAKGQLVQQEGLGGMFGWEIDTDNGDILNWMHEALGHPIADGKNRAPVVDAGVEQSVMSGSVVQLTAAASDADSDVLSYQWQQVSGPAISLSVETARTTEFVAPDVVGEAMVVLRFSAHDGKGGSASDDVRIMVSDSKVNTPPVVNAGASQQVDSGAQKVVLDGSATADADGDTLSFSWTQVSGPTVTLSSINSSKSSFALPAVTQKAQLVFRLTVSDNGVDMYNDTTTVTIIPKDGGGYPVYDANAIYNTGDKVSHFDREVQQDLVWEAKYWVSGITPTRFTDAWILISQVAFPWHTNVAYDTGSEVSHCDSAMQCATYRAIWWTKGDEPGKSSAWQKL